MIDLVYEQWNSVQNQASAMVFNSIPDIEISDSLPIPGMNHLASYYNVEMLIQKLKID